MPKAFRSTCESSMEMETARYRWSWYFVNVCTVMARWPFQNCHDSNTGELKEQWHNRMQVCSFHVWFQVSSVDIQLGW